MRSHVSCSRVALALALMAQVVPLIPSMQSLANAQAVVSETTEAQSPLKQLLERGKQQFRRADFKGAIATYQQVLADPKADSRSKVEAFYQLADIDLWIGQVPQAEDKVKQALKLAEENRDRRGEGRLLVLLGAVERSRGNYAEATQLVNQGLKIIQEAGDRESEALARLQLGIIASLQKQHPKALEIFQEALKIAQASDSQDVIAHLYDWMAETQRGLKDVQQAETLIQQQQDLSKSTGYQLAEYDGLHTVARLRQAQKQSEQVLAARQRQLKIAQLSNNSWFERNTLAEIGEVYIEQKQLDPGLSFYRQALSVARTIDDMSVADVQYQIGMVHHRAQKYPQAREAFQQALVIYRRLNKLPQQANTLLSIGYTYSIQGVAIDEQKNFMQSRKLYEQSVAPLQEGLAIARKIPDKRLESLLLVAIGGAHGKQGGTFSIETKYQQDLELSLKGVQFQENGLTLAREIQDSEMTKIALNSVTSSYYSVFSIYNSSGQYQLALEWNRKLEKLIEETQDSKWEGVVASNELNVYFNLINTYNKPQHYSKLLEAAEKAITLARTLNQPDLEILAILNSAQVHRFWGQYPKALELYQRGLNRARDTQNYLREIMALQAIGLTYDYQANYAQAIAAYEQAAQISRQKNLLVHEVNAMNNIATVFAAQGKYTEALQIQEQNLVLSQRIYERFSKGLTPDNIRAVCLENDDFQKQEESFQKRNSSTQSKTFPFKAQCDYPEEISPPFIRDVFQTLIDGNARLGRHFLGTTFGNIASIYSGQGNYPKAIELYEKTLLIRREMQEPGGEADALNNLGTVYQSQGDLAKATEMFKQALKIAIERGDRSSEIIYRRNLGSAQEDAGQYTEAMKGYEQMLVLARQFGQPSQEAELLNAIGISYASQGQYGEALTYFQKSLKTRQDIGELGNVAMVMTSIGGVYNRLGSFQQAQEYLQQALTIARQIGDLGMEPTLYSSIAFGNREQGEVAQALKNLQTSLTVARAIGKLSDESSSLSSIGRLYLKQSQPEKALEVLQQAFRIQRKTGVLVSQDDTLSYMGQAYIQLNNYIEAQTALRKSLTIARRTNDRSTEGLALSSLGELLSKQNQPELAIAFYKQSVNTYEQIRTGIQKLPLEQQASYTQTVASTYRDLANLLLQQNRVMEAVQVLDLLKVQELQNFLRNNPNTVTRNIEEIACKTDKTGIDIFSQEQVILDTFNTQPSQNSVKLDQAPAIRAAIADLKRTAIDQSLQSCGYRFVQASVQKLSQDAALFYPLVLSDRLELVVFIPGKAPIRKTVPVSQATLEATIQQFRLDIGDAYGNGIPKSDLSQAKATAQKLYTWLIEPIAPDLKAANIQTILYAPDGQLRYIPLAALYDGTTQQWLTQRYQINHLTALALTPLAGQTHLIEQGLSPNNHCPSQL
ncbi:MAG: tetratricopeptide repeat protein [Leptolyngbyaceae cyanobacterium bins.302]|nr:tetratricopeptide repeat protein [Leptolyngbyaceae cyanobacterium bins.302]